MMAEPTPLCAFGLLQYSSFPGSDAAFSSNPLVVHNNKTLAALGVNYFFTRLYSRRNSISISRRGFTGVLHPDINISFFALRCCIQNKIQSMCHICKCSEGPYIQKYKNCNKCVCFTALCHPMSPFPQFDCSTRISRCPVPSMIEGEPLHPLLCYDMHIICSVVCYSSTEGPRRGEL